MKCKTCGQLIKPSSPIEGLRAYLDAVARRTAARAAKGEPYYIENSKKWAKWLEALDGLIEEGGKMGLLEELGQKELTSEQIRALRDILYKMLEGLEPGFLIDMAECALDIPEVAESLRRTRHVSDGKENQMSKEYIEFIPPRPLDHLDINFPIIPKEQEDDSGDSVSEGQDASSGDEPS